MPVKLHLGSPTAPHQFVMLFVLTGKGLVFDCGGLNLKPTGSIENMHMDKGGACSVLGLMHALAATGVRANVVGVVALAENAIGKDACKPHEILKSYKACPLALVWVL